jgi:adhesin HecA-like repeat protein
MVLSISNLFTNQGTIQANQQLDISADTLNNQSDIIAKEVNIGVTTKATNTGKIEPLVLLRGVARMILLLACSVPALVIRLVLVLSALSRLFLMLRLLPAIMLALA